MIFSFNDLGLSLKMLLSFTCSLWRAIGVLATYTFISGPNKVYQNRLIVVKVMRKFEN